MIDRSARVVFVTLAALATLPAQRAEPVLEWQKRTTTIAYGQVPVGKHSLSELAIGTDWRLGNNDASTWRLEMPILAGDAVLAPGEYRISITRTDPSHCAVQVHGSGQGLNGGPDVRVSGELGKAGKPTKKLNIDWARTGAATGANQPAQIVVQFGENEWKGPLTVLGGKSAALPGWKLVVFSVPVTTMASRDKAAVPVATFSRGSGKSAENWNLVLGKDQARLVPWLAAPTDNNGFGPPNAPDKDAITTGKVEAQDSQTEKPGDFVDLKESSLQKAEFVLQLVAGKETLKVTVPEPKAAKVR